MKDSSKLRPADDFGLMSGGQWLGTVAALCLLFCCLAQGAPLPVPGPKPQAPPPAPPIQRVLPKPDSGPGPKPLGVTPYSIGQPTDEEQLYLEYLNRMRANPTAEGQRLAATTDPNVLSDYTAFSVDLNLMQQEFATNPPVPPLAMNAQLLAAARWHSGDMYTNQYQGHNQTNGTTVMNPGDRIAANGYPASFWGENVFSYADSVFQGHAAFAVDWGGPVGGMQDPPGHRDNMLSAYFREVGIGVVDGINGAVGPQLVTQDFGTQVSSSPYITGVVYFDLNGNGFYDLGEGIGGVTVNTPGSSFFTTTAGSGGYALPVPGNGAYTLTFTAPGLSNQVTATISSLQNTKVDLVPSYSPPIISGPNPATLNQNNAYSFTPVPAATAYQWEQAQLLPYTLVEGAENGSSNVTIVSSPGYSVITTGLASSGTHSFNLEHTTPVLQSITLNPTLLVTANSTLSFAKYLGYATSTEVAAAQITVDGGQNWQTVWSQTGNDGKTDSSFVPESVSLGAFAGQTLQVRFVFLFNGGSYFNMGFELGVYFDDIAVSNAKALQSVITNNVTADHAFTFVPTVQTDYLLLARAQINSRALPWGPASVVSVTSGSGSAGIQVAGAPTLSGGQVAIDFTVSNFQPGMSFQLLRTSSLTASWAQDTSATLQTVVANSKFRFTTTATGGGNAFFRIKGG